MGTQRKIIVFFCSFFFSLPTRAESSQDIAYNIGAGLNLIQTYHLSPPSLDQITVQGLAALEQVDSKISLARQLGLVEVIYDYSTKKTVKVSAQDTSESWALKLHQIIQTLKSCSPKLNSATDKQWVDVFFGIMLPTFDPFSRYIADPQGTPSPQIAQNPAPTAPVAAPFGLEVKDQQATLVINTFTPTLAQDILRTIPKPQELKAMTVDLRQTTGGSFEGGVAFCDLFIESGIITQTRGRHPQSNHIYRATAETPFKNTELAVLIGKNTYSTGEMVASAFQDHKRATLMGEPTFGKDSVQRLLPLPNGALLGLTWANFYSPKNQSVRGKGVIPSPSA